MKIKIFVSAVLLCILFSCKKQDSPKTNCDKTVASIAGTYSLVKFEVGTNGAFQDATSELEACGLDDKISLNKDGSTVTQDLGTVCSPPDNSRGSWSISPSGQITINDPNPGPIDISTADITSFDCSTLVLTASDPNSPGTQFRLTMKK
ncbi:MAG: hypothetical protein WKG06_26370 [Segetibacter sp.]